MKHFYSLIFVPLMIFGKNVFASDSDSSTKKMIEAITVSPAYSNVIQTYEDRKEPDGGIYLDCRFNETSFSHGIGTTVATVECPNYQWMDGHGPGCGLARDTRIIAVLIPDQLDNHGDPESYKVKSLTAIDY